MFALALGACADSPDEEPALASTDFKVNSSFAGNSIRICGARDPAADTIYRCDSTLPASTSSVAIPAPDPADPDCPCFDFADDGTLTDPTTGLPAQIGGLCPSDDLPIGDWTFDYTLYTTPACTGPVLNAPGSNVACYDSHDLGSHAHPNQSADEILVAGLNESHVLCLTAPLAVCTPGFLLASWIVAPGVTQLIEIDPNTAIADVLQTTTGYAYRALSRNPIDGELYAISDVLESPAGGNHLLRVTPSGVVDLGLVPALGTERWVAGTFLDDGTYALASDERFTGLGQYSYLRLQVTPTIAVVDSAVVTTAPVIGGPLTWVEVDDFLWGNSTTGAPVVFEPINHALSPRPGFTAAMCTAITAIETGVPFMAQLYIGCGTPPDGLNPLLIHEDYPALTDTVIGPIINAAPPGNAPGLTGMDLCP
jgi:hypothetical protein